MKRGTKRALLIAGGVIVVLLATPVIMLLITFSGDSSIQDGEELAPHTRVVRDGYVSAVMLDIGDGVALVDCTNDTDAKAITTELTRRKLDADAVKAIFITHGHPDHTNGCAKFKKAEIYALATEKDLIEGKTKAKGPMTKLFPAKDVGVRVTHPLADGEVVHVGNLEVTAFALPGHTAGSAVYFADGVLHFGDGASATKDGKIAPAKYLFSDDQNQDKASIKALKTRLEPRSAEIKKLAFAHSGSLSGYDPLVSFAGAN